MIVRFHSLDSFLDELRLDAELVERGVLRLTVERRHSPPMTTVALVATAAVARTVLTLRLRLGELLFPDAEWPPAVTAALNHTRERLTRAAKELGLQIRGGVLEPVGGS